MEILETRVLHRPAAKSRYLPEGPRALAPSRLLWLTIQSGPTAAHGELHVLNTLRSENRSWRLPGRPGFAFATDRDGVFLVGMERAVGLFDTVRQRFSPLVEGVDGHTTGTIVNDGELCAAGLVFGTKDTAFAERKASLWFLRRQDLRLFHLRDDQLCSNGKIVRELANGALELFDIDSPSRVVMRYELDPATGTLSPATIAVDLRKERAVPDGMVLVPGTDEAVIAMFDPEPAEYGRALWCSLRTGEVLREFRTVGAAQVTCPAWLPTAQGCQLVLTTAAENLDATRIAGQPNAGCLFVCEVPQVTPALSPVWRC